MKLSDFQSVQCFDMEWRFPQVVHYESGDYRISLGRDNQWGAVFLATIPGIPGSNPHILGWYDSPEQAMEHCALHRDYVEGRKQSGAIEGQWRDVFAKAQRSARQKMK